MAGNTHLVYLNALKAFAKFRNDYEIEEMWPVPGHHLALFISYCFEQGYAPATITTYTSGISFQHKLYHWNDPTDLFIIKKLLDGCRRIRPKSDVRAPITISTLKSICHALPFVCFSPYEVLLFKAAYLLAFFGLLRVSELVFTCNMYRNRPLTARDVRIDKDSSAVIVTIRFSKNNQYGSPTVLRIPASEDTTLCCVTAIAEYLKCRPDQVSYFFSHANSLPLTRSQFSGVLSKAIRFAGLPVHKFKTHSFRIGRASTLAAQGISNETIKLLGRWKSNAVQSYIRLY
ncbi:MAG: hypothetical protein N0C90_11155 [Candidatus Thiodiazotropha endolucinida]|nr:hypothetical protein [Candidatus Thiodiazotropha taylori]MCG8048785.1 hypothetical protein [Candidatus Thiodiazotropha taylori]MCW4261918.1 hypothetical protein [Candidatus Thiodiazotropha endolucinida]MCW4346542.1 hypothetical protein [Candidatus Thiodiazotropha endolucinida]